MEFCNGISRPGNSMEKRDFLLGFEKVRENVLQTVYTKEVAKVT